MPHDTEDHELDLYADNTSELYGQKQSIIANIRRRLQNKTYDAARAWKLWLYWYDAAAKRYVREFGGDVRTMFPRASRVRLAKERAKRECGKIRRGEYS